MNPKLDIEMMTETVSSASKFPDNYKSDSQRKMLERFKYLLNMSEDLVLQSSSQKKQIMQQRSEHLKQVSDLKKET